MGARRRRSPAEGDGHDRIRSHLRKRRSVRVTINHHPISEEDPTRPDGRLIRGWASLIIVSLAAWPGSAFADYCFSQGEASASSEGGRFTLKARLEEGTWKATLSDVKTGKAVSGTLEKLSWHAHFRAFISRGGSRIVVFEPIAGIGTDNRVLIYDRNFRLLKSFDLKELLTRDELGRVGFSISHTHGVSAFDPKRKADAWLEGGDFAFRTNSGRTVRIELAEPKVLEPPADRDEK
jgi:hypothetical protein